MAYIILIFQSLFFPIQLLKLRKSSRLFFLLINFVLLLIYVVTIRVDGFNTHDMQTYINQYNSQVYSSFHSREPFFWVIYRLPSHKIPILSALILFDFTILGIFYWSFRNFGLAKTVSLSAAIIFFHFFPFELGRNGAYRQYWAMAFGFLSVSFFINIKRKKNLDKLALPVTILVPLFHNGALVQYVNLLLRRISLRKILLLTVPLLILFTLVIYSVNIEKLLYKIERDRQSSGTFQTEYFYFVFIALILYSLCRGKDRLFSTTNFVKWAVVILLFFTFSLIQLTSTYSERTGMFFLTLVYPVLLYKHFSNFNNYFDYFLLTTLSILPLFLPAIQIVIRGNHNWF